MSQAIITKYLPQTNTKPARVKAMGSGPGAPSIIVAYDPGGENTEGLYWACKRAAMLFAEKFSWRGTWRGQVLGDGFIFVDSPTISFVSRYEGEGPKVVVTRGLLP